LSTGERQAATDTLLRESGMHTPPRFFTFLPPLAVLAMLVLLGSLPSIRPNAIGSPVGERERRGVSPPVIDSLLRGDAHTGETGELLLAFLRLLERTTGAEPVSDAHSPVA
jgi:hypothetical protein